MLENHYLDDFFNPKTIAVVGASERPNSVGLKIMSNLIASQFTGGIFPVNPKHTNVLGKTCYPSVADIPDKVDLAVITTPAKTVSTIIEECGKRDIKSVIIISAGFSEMGADGKALEQQILAIAKLYNIHFIGPNCLGIMRPASHLNATFDNNYALPGNIALVSQSGAICAAILDWGLKKEIGFSTILSLGNSVDLDFGEILDYLALDPLTKSILLYIEGVHHPRRFMRGLRAAARVKPVIAIKAGRHSSGVRAVHSHTGALVGDDVVFSAALSRGGAVRVMSIEQLFTAAEVLSSPYRAKGNRLIIVTNGGGAGVMAADRATDLNIALPTLDGNTLTELNKVLPLQWSHQNPIDILGDATPERYNKVIKACINDKNADALLTILVPVAMSEPYKVAQEICMLAPQISNPLITCWMGEKQTETSRQLFAEHQIPCYSTPEVAVEAFSYLSDYYHNQQLLLEIPAPFASCSEDNVKEAGLIINAALKDKRTILTTSESKAVLSAIGIPVSQTIEAHTAEEAVTAAESVGYPVVMKISSPDITHKQDVGGVKLNVPDAEGVQIAFNQIMETVTASKPEAKISGVTIERMYSNPNYRELMIGVIRDKVFGPVISFGLGGSLVEVIQDRAVALPPLNSFLAKRLVEKTRAIKLLGSFRGKPPAKMEALINILLRVSDMVCELPEIQEMDINPLLIDDKGAVAVDARFVVAEQPESYSDYPHVAIHPYPRKLISNWRSKEGASVTIRPIRPEDAVLEQEFVHELSASTKYYRFMQTVKQLTPETVMRFTQIDYEKEMAFVATVNHNNKEVIIGIARYFTQSDNESCEFAIAVADTWQHKGLGARLMEVLIEAAKSKGIKSMVGYILSDNSSMLEFARHLGFSINRNKEDFQTILAVKDLV